MERHAAKGLPQSRRRPRLIAGQPSGKGTRAGAILRAWRRPPGLLPDSVGTLHINVYNCVLPPWFGGLAVGSPQDARHAQTLQRSRVGASISPSGIRTGGNRMLELLGREFRLCDGVRRRSFLKLGSLSLAGLSWADLLRVAPGRAPRHGGDPVLDGGRPVADRHLRSQAGRPRTDPRSVSIHSHQSARPGCVRPVATPRANCRQVLAGAFAASPAQRA